MRLLLRFSLAAPGPRSVSVMRSLGLPLAWTAKEGSTVRLFRSFQEVWEDRLTWKKIGARKLRPWGDRATFTGPFPFPVFLFCVYAGTSGIPSAFYCLFRWFRSSLGGDARFDPNGFSIEQAAQPTQPVGPKGTFVLAAPAQRLA